MSAPAGWQKGSFRGLPFVTETHEGSGGRRLVVHEFPQSDDAVVEDMGRKAKRFSLNCHIRGKDFLSRANAFEDALDAGGDGTLIHPWRGSMRVLVDDYSRSDSTVDGGIVTFSVQFVKSGLPAAPQGAPDTAAQVKQAAKKSKLSALDRFAKKFNVAGVTAFVEQASGKLTTGLATVAAVQGALTGGAGPALRLFQDAATALGAPGLLRDAAGLALATFDLVETLSLLGEAVPGRIAALGTLLDFGGDLDPVIGATPARLAEADNQAAFVQLVNLAAAGEIVVAIADTPFGSYQEAVALRDDLAGRFDDRALRQADSGDDDGAAAFDDLRRAMVADIAARLGTLVRLQDYTPAITEPALVIAHRLYGAFGVAARAEEIVARNHIAHPGFVTGGQRLRVLTPDLAVANG